MGYYIPYAPWCWYIYLHVWMIFRAHVDNYTIQTWFLWFNMVYTGTFLWDISGRLMDIPSGNDQHSYGKSTHVQWKINSFYGDCP